jgi:thiol-disulfide isomerase/thioredoxin
MWTPSSRLLIVAWPLTVSACATPSPSATTHGTLSALSDRKAGAEFCDHRVPADVCVKHHPELAARFTSMGDWCGEHDVPESQCLRCHPDLTFAPLPELPADADLGWLSWNGEDVEALAAHAVKGKVTVFDFYADWCSPCRRIDEHVYGLLKTRRDLSVRKPNVVSWETTLAKRHLKAVPTLPYLVVFGRDGQQVGSISGFDLAALDAAIATGVSR